MHSMQLTFKAEGIQCLLVFAIGRKERGELQTFVFKLQVLPCRLKDAKDLPMRRLESPARYWSTVTCSTQFNVRLMTNFFRFMTLAN